MSLNVIYARKSTESEDRQVLSIQAQIDELRLLAARRGQRIDEILQESYSAKAPGRPIFTALMRRVEKREIQRIFCWKMDRLSRNPYDSGVILQAQRDGKLPEIITSDGVKTGSSNDRLMGTFELAFATKYIDDLQVNVKRGNRAKYRDGWLTYRPPIGYLEDHATKHIIKDPDRFDLVRRMWDLLLSGGMRPSLILKVANESWGLRTRKTANAGGKPLIFQHIYKIFSNPYYAGLIRLRSTGETFQGKHTPMISMEEFELAQRLLDRPDRERPSKHEFAYAGILRCARCSGVLTPEEHIKKRSKRRYVYYRCRQRVGKPACGTPLLPEPVFESEVFQLLGRLTVSDDARDWITGQLRESLSQSLAQRDAARRSLLRAIEDVKREEQNLVGMRLRDQLDDATYESQRIVIVERRTVLELKLSQPEARPEELLGRIERLMDFAQAAAEAFDASKTDAVRRRLILLAIAANFEVNGKSVRTVAKEPFSFLERGTQFPLWLTIVEDLRTWVLTKSDGFHLPNLRVPCTGGIQPRAAGPGK